MTNDELRYHIESLHANLHQLFEQSQKHDEQIAANATQIAANATQIAALVKASQQDGENIRALARIAELHQARLDDHGQRLTDLE
jgi:peptidoglycan hydrolase CwlO-like protein